MEPRKKEAEVKLVRLSLVQSRKQQFEDQVREAIAFIDKGEAEQIVLSRRLEADFKAIRLHCIGNYGKAIHLPICIIWNSMIMSLLELHRKVLLV